jgi:hypothetical protein
VALGIPFTNPKPLGWSLFEVLSSAQMTAVNANAANAADGSYWSDLAPLKNWNYQQPTVPSPMIGRTLIFDPSTRRWLILGLTGGEGSAIWTLNGTRWFGPFFLSGSPLLNGFGAAWVNNAGVILAGGTPASASSAKLRSSINGGTAWTQQNIGTSNTQTVSAIVYSESLGLWFVTIGGAVSHDGLYSSPDMTTWTNRYNGAPNTYFAVRNSASPIVLGTSLQIISPDGLTGIRSTDGISWPFVTFPEAFFSQGCWSDYWGKFFFSGPTGIWSSPDATTGSWTRVNASETNPVNIAARGRLLLKGDAKASVDGGASWIPIADTTDVDLFVNAGPFGAAMARGASRDLYVSQQVGI